MSFSDEIKTKALVACGRYCCICHKFCGNKIEIHHIKAKADGGADTFDNAIPLCFDCHAEVRQYDPRHPKGTKFTENELRQHRDKWYQSVAHGNVSAEKVTTNNPIKVTQDDPPAFLIRATTVKQLMADLDGVFAIDYDYDEPDAREDQEIIMRFMQKLQDIVDLEEIFLEISERMNMSFELTSDLQELEKHHLWVFTSRDVRKINGGKTPPDIFPVLIVRVLKDTNQTVIHVPASTKENDNETPIQTSKVSS